MILKAIAGSACVRLFDEFPCSAWQAITICPTTCARRSSGPPFSLGGATEFGRWLVVMLDSWVANDAGGRLGEAQLSDLRDILQHASQPACAPVSASSSYRHAQRLARSGRPRDADEFMALIREHANVRGVLWGHVHQSLDSFIDGVRFMASPATCAQFLPGSETSRSTAVRRATGCWN